MSNVNLNMVMIHTIAENFRYCIAIISFQVINGPEMGMPRCGSLDSLRDGSHIPHDDGKSKLFIQELPCMRIFFFF